MALTDNAGGLLLVGYPVLIAASGLWFRVRTVWLTALMAALGFGTLAVTVLPREQRAHAPHHVVIFLFCLLALGPLVAYQVQRVRVLSRYYEQRPRV